MCDLEMKPNVYLDSVNHHFSLYQVIVEPTKIINNLLKQCKIPDDFQSHFSASKISRIFLNLD